MNQIDIVYTPWENLKKTQGMDVGQVSFHNNKEVIKVRVDKRINEIVNRLEKTKLELHPDFRAEREKRDAEERVVKHQVLKQRKDQEKSEEKKRKDLADLKSYNSLMKSENMSTNYDKDNDSDDFM